MGTLIELYNQTYEKIKSFQDQIDKLNQEIKEKSADTSANVAERIAKLEEQLEKIDDYVLRIKGFQELAKKNLDSQNVLTIEAPPGYRVNMNRLRNWAMMIDPMSSNDPYAQRVYVVAKCDEHFLEKKRIEFQERIEELKHSHDLAGTNEEIEGLKKELQELKEELNKYAMSNDVSDLSKFVVEENERNWHKEAPDAFHNPEEASDFISPGAYAASLNFDKESRMWLKNAMGDFYDAEKGRVLIPVQIDNRKEYVLKITCTPINRKKLDKALQNLLLSTIIQSPAGSRRIYVYDGVRFNSSSLGSLRQLAGSFVMEQIPRNPDQLTESLEQLVSSFADVDEIIDQSDQLEAERFDSVREYNASVPSDKKLPLSTILLFGWPNAFEGRDLELLQRMMTNYERYGLSFITVGYQNLDKNHDTNESAMPEYALENAIQVSMMQNDTTITFPGGNALSFSWYSFQGELSDSFKKSLLSYKPEDHRIGNEYLKRYPLTDIPQYERKYKQIILPFGINGKDQAYELSFEDDNFATYLVGASRSGKSTLLHTLIAGLLRNYHPDNVELWLADFKQLEFKKYMEHCPPHVKYILLDESTELVFDLIDKLTDKMMERQRLFARLGKEKIDQLDPMQLDEPVPLIFVILDEFSIMSQSIADSQLYRLKLQNLLAKGAALGLRFLFSSQTFTTGVAGLTPTARAQIQQRIAMKGSKEEISETLELSANLKNEQVRNWMDALPPHYALVKRRISADTLPEVKRYYVMYFPDYAPRDEMIDQINSRMIKDSVYHINDVNYYVDKKPVLVDGNSFNLFPETEWESVSTTSGDEVLFSAGTPRLMEYIKWIPFTRETRENLLLVARVAEQHCAASIVTSAIKAFFLQGKNVQIWAYERNSLYQNCKKEVWNGPQFDGIRLFEGMNQVCDAIRELKVKISHKEIEDTLIVLLGIDRIYSDFDFFDGKSAPAFSDSFVDNLNEKMKEEAKKLEKSGVIAQDEEGIQIAAKAREWAMKMGPLRRKLKEQGKSEEEIKEAIDQARKEFYGGQIQDEQTSMNPAELDQPKEAEEIESEERSDFKQKQGAYDAADDFLYVVKQGSRLGYHFFAVFNNYADIHSAGIKLDWFRHRMSFQVSEDDSRELFGKRIANTLPERICQYSDSLNSFSFRPYLHYGIEWDGWGVDKEGNAIKPF